MSEWLKETGCKPVGSAYAGSNPAPPIHLLRWTPADMSGQSRENALLTPDIPGHRRTPETRKERPAPDSLRGFSGDGPDRLRGHGVHRAPADAASGQVLLGAIQQRARPRGCEPSPDARADQAAQSAHRFSLR